LCGKSPREKTREVVVPIERERVRCTLKQNHLETSAESPTSTGQKGPWNRRWGTEARRNRTEGGRKDPWERARPTRRYRIWGEMGVSCWPIREAPAAAEKQMWYRSSGKKKRGTYLSSASQLTQDPMDEGDQRLQKNATYRAMHLGAGIEKKSDTHAGEGSKGRRAHWRPRVPVLHPEGGASGRRRINEENTLKQQREAEGQP